MEDNKLQLDIELNTHLTDIKKTFDSIKGNEVFSTKEGQKARNEIAGNLETALKLINKEGGVTVEEFKALNSAVNIVFKNLTTFAAKISTITPKVQELNNEIGKVTKEINKKEEKIRKTKTERSKEERKINDLQNAGYAFLLKSKDGNPTKQRFTSPEVIRKHQKAKDLIIRDPNGKFLRSEKEISGFLASNLTKYEVLNLTLEELNTELGTLKNQLVDLRGKLNKQKEEDILSGATTNDMISPLNEKNIRISELLNGIKNKEAEKQQKAIAGEVQATTIELQKQQGALTKAFKQFTIYALVLRGVKLALREATGTIKELDKFLTEQAMVTGLTREQTYNLIKDYQKLGLEVGATTKEIAGVATEYMKQGKTIEESLALTKAAVSAAKVARVSVGDSVNYLTTALNGYRLSADQAMKVSDKFAAVAASSASDYDELAIALSKVASQANLAGMSIDYTTALLTKGLETTREAPETMGTALKTIIARMRELSDYGETLEGDIDINNVETQLKYVGIELRNTTGELRSTESVLDDLGKKWDTLNANQQAALAKALAGTRQQSRLIAMMDDYERVTELQQISLRSQGATLSQASTYLQGIEASLNKVSVAWERIITNLVNSEFLIESINTFSRFLDNIGNFTENLGGQITVYGAVLFAITGIIAKKQIENQIAKDQLKLQKEMYIQTLEQHRLELIQQILSSNGVELEENELKLLLAQYKAQVGLNKAKQAGNEISQGRFADTNAGGTEFAQANAELKEVNNKISQAKNKLDEARLSGKGLGQDLKTTEEQLEYARVSSNSLLNNSIRLLALRNVYTTVQLGLKKTILAVTKQQMAVEKAASIAKFATMPVILLAVGAAMAAFAIATRDTRTELEKTKDAISELSNKIYNMNENLQSLKKVTNEFEDMDSKIIKTNEDLEKMNNLLKGAKEKIDFTKGGTLSDKEAKQLENNFELLTINQKIAYIEKEKLRLKQEVLNADKKQIQLLEKSQDSEKLLQDADIQASVYAVNNTYLYEEIDNLKKKNQYKQEDLLITEQIGQRILENLSIEESYRAAQSNYSKNLANTLINKGKQSNILISGEGSFAEQIKAFREISAELDSSALEAFEKAFSGIHQLSTELSEDSIKIVDKLGFSVAEINDFTKAMVSVGISTDDTTNKFIEFLSNLEHFNNDIGLTLRTTFADTFDDLVEGSEEYLEIYNKLLSAYEKAVGTGILNMGQNMDKLKNNINSFYTIAGKWDTMAENEKTSFINDHKGLFDGAGGEKLLKAFGSKNYKEIEKALYGNEGLRNQIRDRLQEIETEIAIEEAKIGEAKNEAYIAWLKDQRDYLKDENNLFKASLETRQKQEEAQIKEYKTYLEKQRDALKDSLEKQKKAYQDYFTAIKEGQDDEEYQEKVNLITSNIGKLASSGDASSQSMKYELEQELRNLEKERIQELRERAQDAIIQNMDNTIEDISEKFDKLLENNQQLLLALTGELKNPTNFISSLINQKIKDGATGLELESFAQELQGIYGGNVGSFNWDKISVKEKSNNGSLVLNINGSSYDLDRQDQEVLYKTIMNALTQLGLR